MITKELQKAINQDHAKAYREAYQRAHDSELVAELDFVRGIASYKGNTFLADKMNEIRQIAMRDITELYLLRRGLDPGVTAEEIANTMRAMKAEETEGEK